jgi:serine beta-lactamase-like protein LACTB
MKVPLVALRSRTQGVRPSTKASWARSWFFPGILFLFLCPFSAVKLAGSEPQGFSHEQIAVFEKLITSYMAENHVPGLSIAIGQNDRVLWSQGFGLSDVENFVPAKADTVYRFGSVSKPITATAVMQLAEKGKLNLDAPIQQYCPAYPVKKWKVTAGQLLGHLGGVRYYRGSEQTGYEEYTRHFNSVIEGLEVFKDDPLEVEPGTQYLYSSFGYNLLGCAVEGASGMKFTDYLRQSIFEPAGMSRTQQDDIFKVIYNRAQGYSSRDSEDGSLRNSAIIDNSYKVAGGGLCGTAEDLVRFGMAVQDGRLIQAATLASMEAPQKTRDGRRTAYGLGWEIEELDGRKVIHHYGGQARVTAALFLLPGKGALAILINRENAHISDTAEALYRMLVSTVSASSEPK